MLHIQPLYLNADGADLYRLHCKLEDGEAIYNFGVSIDSVGGSSFRSLRHEDAYYFVTYDDPEGDTIEQCIKYFDNARQEKFASGELNLLPASIRIEPELAANPCKYTVTLGSAQNQTSHLVTVSEEGNTRTCKWPFGAASATLDNRGFWNFDKSTTNPLLACILTLHQALHPRYTVERSLG